MFKKLALAGALCCALAVPALAQLAPIVSGSQAATLSAVALPSLATSNGVVLKADASNTGTIYLGPCATLTTANGYPLKSGEAISYGVGNLSAICELGVNTTDKLYFTFSGN